MVKDDADDHDCIRCNGACHVPFGFERPDHGLCWPCCSDVVSELQEQLTKYGAHTMACPSWDDPRAECHCTCGWDDVVKTMEERKLL